MIEGEAGFGARPPGTTDKGPLFDLWGGGASVSTLLSSHGRLGLGALVGYEVLRGAPGGRVDGAGNPLPSLTLHGPRLGLRLLYLVDPLSWRAFRSPPDAWATALTLYVGSWWSGLDVSHPSPFLGVALEGISDSKRSQPEPGHLAGGRRAAPATFSRAEHEPAVRLPA